MPGWLAIGLTAILSTVVHGVTGRPIAFATILLYALFATFIVLRESALWMICGIHAGWNWRMGNVYGIPVSGLNPHTTSLVFRAPAPGSPDWLTGGTFGTEGGPAATITLLVATAVAFVLYRRTAKTWPALPSLRVSTSGHTRCPRSCPFTPRSRPTSRDRLSPRRHLPPGAQ